MNAPGRIVYDILFRVRGIRGCNIVSAHQRRKKQNGVLLKRKLEVEDGGAIPNGFLSRALRSPKSTSNFELFGSWSLSFLSLWIIRHWRTHKHTSFSRWHVMCCCSTHWFLKQIWIFSFALRRSYRFNKTTRKSFMFTSDDKAFQNRLDIYTRKCIINYISILYRIWNIFFSRYMRNVVSHAIVNSYYYVFYGYQLLLLLYNGDRWSKLWEKNFFFALNRILFFLQFHMNHCWSIKVQSQNIRQNWFYWIVESIWWIRLLFAIGKYINSIYFFNLIC